MSFSNSDSGSGSGSGSNGGLTPCMEGGSKVSSRDLIYSTLFCNVCIESLMVSSCCNRKLLEAVLTGSPSASVST